MLLPGRRCRWPLATMVGFWVAMYFLQGFQENRWLNQDHERHDVSSTPLLREQQAFWLLLYSHILDGMPRCPPVIHAPMGHVGVAYDPSGSAPDRPDRLNVTEVQVRELRSRHQAYVSALRYTQYKLPFRAKTRGIVTTAGGRYLPVAVVSIRMLRETGCELPVEVFLATEDEWDSAICDNIFPQLTAKCVILADIFDPLRQNATLGIHKYQYKIMSVVFSSFEEVLFLDSDCFPIYDPTEQFSGEPFSRTGMIVWPDFWYRSESLLFFDIAQISPPSLGSSPATESGELFYSKPQHTNSLLLALYYNFYGPEFYYPLQSQGGPGEGDKETFFWSAMVFNESFYSVHEHVHALGYTTTDSQWRGSAMVQFDPLQDLRRQRQIDAMGEQHAEQGVRPLFVHANYPKIDPGEIFQDESFGVAGPTKDADGKMRRIWHSNREETVAFFGFDVERRLWNVVRSIACDHEGKFRAWDGLQDVCKRASDYWNAVFIEGSA